MKDRTVFHDILDQITDLGAHEIVALALFVICLFVFSEGLQDPAHWVRQ